MAGITNFPTALDDNSSLIDVSDGVSSLQAAHHNNLKEAIRAVQSKVGINLTSDPASLDYRLGNATAGHRHDGASGQGAQISATAIAGLASYIAGATAGAGGGFTPVGIIVEQAGDYNAVASSTKYLPMASYYDFDWNTIGSIPTRMGIIRNPTDLAFESVEAGVWAFQGAVNVNSMGTLGNKVILHFNYPGAYNETFTIPTTVTGLDDNFHVDRVFPLATGGRFGIQVQNVSTAVGSAAVGYAAFDLIRLSDRLE